MFASGIFYCPVAGSLTVNGRGKVAVCLKMQKVLGVGRSQRSPLYEKLEVKALALVVDRLEEQQQQQQQRQH